MKLLTKGPIVSSSKFNFDATQQYQLDAISSVVDLFEGQPSDSQALVTKIKLLLNEGDLYEGDAASEIGAIGNNILVDDATVLENMQRIQDRLGLEVSEALFEDKKDFDIEMETGTGKTYVYLRTLFELNKKYGFTKFVILVPSVAIREGVKSSIELMRDHFSTLYPGQNFDVTVYSGKNAEQLQSFATSTTMQIEIMTISSIREKAAKAKKEGTADTAEAEAEEARLILNRRRDKLTGLRPIDFLASTKPVVVVDEPQNMDGELSLDALNRLNPSMTLRYSATHNTKRNIVYKLDPVDAHELGLVKQILVADVVQQGQQNTPYVRLIGTQNLRGKFTANLELDVKLADGSISRKNKKVESGKRLERETNNPVYEGYIINNISIASGNDPAKIDLSPFGELKENESTGGVSTEIFREMIRETIREHIRKEISLKDSGIKVLSLFFISKVASYLGDSESYDGANGELVRWFDEIYAEEVGKQSSDSRALFAYSAKDIRRAYFSQVKKGGTTQYLDSSGSTEADNDSYELIMKDRQTLLDPENPVRFIFSHSALREGWDNPNVFQICVLREMSGENERRQTIGRGLRLPVRKTDNGYVRVQDRSLATLSVIANETYADFAANLQSEYKKAGIEIGLLRVNEFAKLWKLDSQGKETDEPLGFQQSKLIYEHLVSENFVLDGKMTDKYRPMEVGFSLNLPSEFIVYESAILQLIDDIKIERFVKPKIKRVSRALNKQIFADEEFSKFWEAITKKTTYRVTVDTTKVRQKCIQALQDAPDVQRLQIQVNKAEIKIVRGGAIGEAINQRVSDLSNSYELPNIVSELQAATSLTRSTIAFILTNSGRLQDFLDNPVDFLVMARKILQTELATLVVEGVQYQQVEGTIYELRELQKDGEDEKDRFLDQLYHLTHKDKSDFDYVVFDSEVERKFAEKLDQDPNIRFFMKLPSRFKIPTPVGNYNPDWAIIKFVEGQDRVYLIRETKGSQYSSDLRPTEKAKIESAKQHFKAIGLENYGKSAPDNWNL
jgi:type III restriction enzyme